uniref:hypothetical protein n=1 Tax=Methylocaldum sp. TaxID=1969727 RepID=UPI00321FC69A
QDCQFELWFTNRGPGAWTGRPTLTDTLPPGATFKSGTAPWVCNQAGAAVTCEHPDVTLPAMQSLKVTITLTMPATIPAGAKNCVRVQHPPGYVDPVPGNDEACAGLPPSGPQTPPPPRSEKCNATIKAGGDTPETIDIDLTGYQGTAKFSWKHYSIKDRMKVTAGGQLIHDTQCVGGSGSKDFPIAGLTSIRVEVIPNCDGSTGTQWEFKVECPQAAPPQQSPAGLPDFEMKKSQTTPACTPGGSCSFEVQLINKGPGPWTDRPELKDTLPPGATFESVSPAPWTCTQSGAELRCKHPTDLVMQSGTPVTFTITAKMPGTIPPGAENCIEIVWGPYRDHNPANDRACTPVRTTPPSPPAPPRSEKCNATIKAGGDTPETIDVDLGGYQGTAKFSWEHYNIKDHMKVTAGGQLIHDTQCVGGAGSKDFPAAGLPSVRVEVIPNCAGGTSGTKWEFKVECPPLPLTVEEPEFAPKPPKIVTPPVLCPHGTVRQGEICVKVEPPKAAPTPKVHPPKKPPKVKTSCPKGYVYNRRTHRCVPVRVPPRVQPLPPCPYGTIRIGQLCVRIHIPPPTYKPHGGGGHHD